MSRCTVFWMSKTSASLWFYYKNISQCTVFWMSKTSASLWFYYKNMSRCTVFWMSKTSASLWFYYKNMSRCTVFWMSKTSASLWYLYIRIYHDARSSECQKLLTLWVQNVHIIKPGLNKLSRNVEAASVLGAKGVTCSKFRGPTNIRHHCTKLSRLEDLAPGICAPLD